MALFVVLTQFLLFAYLNGFIHVFALAVHLLFRSNFIKCVTKEEILPCEQPHRKPLGSIQNHKIFQSSPQLLFNKNMAGPPDIQLRKNQRKSLDNSENNRRGSLFSYDLISCSRYVHNSHGMKIKKQVQKHSSIAVFPSVTEG